MNNPFDCFLPDCTVIVFNPEICVIEPFCRYMFRLPVDMIRNTVPAAENCRFFAGTVFNFQRPFFYIAFFFCENFEVDTGAVHPFKKPHSAGNDKYVNF